MKSQDRCHSFFPFRLATLFICFATTNYVCAFVSHPYSRGISIHSFLRPHHVIPTSEGRRSRKEVLDGKGPRWIKEGLRRYGKKKSNTVIAPTREQLLIDCRSDTVTKPTAGMREAMASAIVGDDVFEDDYTVKELEDRIAKMFQKESALYFPSGTMCNLAAIMSWCGSRGSEMILGDKSHIFMYEQGGMSQIAGVVPRTIPNAPDGTLPLDEIEDAIRADNVHFTTTELITLENTHNYCGGRMLSPEYTQRVGDLAKANEIPLHIDGARIWNSAAKQGIPLSDLTGPADSVSVCLSKGLGAPCGSVLVGPSSFIRKARRVRKSLGGGMRQVGIVAAAGMVALDDYEAGMLTDDHIRAKVIADAVAKLPGFQISVDSVETNIVLIEMSNDHDVTPQEIANYMEELGVLVIPFGPNNVRLVVHRDITDENVVAIIDAFKSVATLHLWPRPSANALAIPNRQTKKTTAIITTTEDVIDTAVDQQQLSGDEANIVDTNAIYEEDKEGTAATKMVDSEEKEMFYEEAVIHGMSLSSEGFCAILRGLVCDRYIRINITPYDPMSEGLDQEQPDTPEAVTLLQLLQGIDVESHLGKDHLSSLCKLDMQGADPIDIKRCNANVLSLHRAQILHTYTPSNKYFEGCFKLRSVDPSSPVRETIDEQTLGRQEYDDEMNQELISVAVDDASIIDRSVNRNVAGDVEFERRDSSNDVGVNSENGGDWQSSAVVDMDAIDDNFEDDRDEEPEIDFEFTEGVSVDKSNITVFTTRNTEQGLIFAEKTMDCKQAFEFVALALRHNAIIEAQSSLFHQEDLSFTAEQLFEYFPKLVEANPEARSSNTRNYNFYDLNCEVDRLRRLYEESIRQGNAEKSDIILDKINTLTDEVDGFTLSGEDQEQLQPLQNSYYR